MSGFSMTDIFDVVHIVQDALKLPYADTEFFWHLCPGDFAVIFYQSDDPFLYRLSATMSVEPTVKK